MRRLIIYGNTKITRSAGQFVIDGDFEFEEVDLNDYVQVQFLSGPDSYSRSKLYTYIDPGMGLAPGDLVDVPTNYHDHNVAMVKELGRGSWPKSCKAVIGRFARIDA
jgi:hypothetical protein